MFKLLVQKIIESRKVGTNNVILNTSTWQTKYLEIISLNPQPYIHESTKIITSIYIERTLAPIQAVSRKYGMVIMDDGKRQLL